MLVLDTDHLAEYQKGTSAVRQINAYTKLRQLFRFFATWEVLDWTEAAATRFTVLRSAKTRGGTMDLKIAGIALANDAVLLTRNLHDFENVPGLKAVDWLS